MPIIPALWEAELDGSPELRSSRPAWSKWWNTISTKNTKIIQAWWHTPVIPTTWEAEVGELLEPRKQRLQWAEIVPPHSSLGVRERLHLKKKYFEVLLAYFKGGHTSDRFVGVLNSHREPLCKQVLSPGQELRSETVLTIMNVYFTINNGLQVKPHHTPGI